MRTERIALSAKKLISRTSLTKPTAYAQTGSSTSTRNSVAAKRIGADVARERWSTALWLTRNRAKRRIGILTKNAELLLSSSETLIFRSHGLEKTIRRKTRASVNSAKIQTLSVLFPGGLMIKEGRGVTPLCSVFVNETE